MRTATKKLSKAIDDLVEARLVLHEVRKDPSRPPSEVLAAMERVVETNEFLSRSIAEALSAAVSTVGQRTSPPANSFKPALPAHLVRADIERRRIPASKPRGPQC